MKELSLNILDVAENSVKARASLTEILLTEKDRKYISEKGPEQIRSHAEDFVEKRLAAMYA